MKKLLFVAATGLLSFLVSCNDKSSGSSEVNSAGEKAKANNKAVLRAIENGEAIKLDSFITNDAIDHSGENGMKEVKGIENIQKDLATIKQDFSTLHIDVTKEAVEGDYLFVLSKMTGTTSANPVHGMPPNQSIEMNSVDVLKFNSDGKFTEHWLFNDPKDMAKMMGGDHTMNGKMDNKMAPKDSMKK